MNSVPMTFEQKNPFANIGTFGVDVPELEAREELEQTALKQIEADQADPTQQQYYRREDRKTVVKTATEYNACHVAGIRMTVIPYTTAVHLLKVEEARQRQAKKARQKTKASRKARRNNR